MNKLKKSKEEWLKIINAQQYSVLFEEATERSFTSPLNEEKRKGTFVCAACNQPLFSSDTKYDSGTGWPSFFQHLPDAIERPASTRSAPTNATIQLRRATTCVR